MVGGKIGSSAPSNQTHGALPKGALPVYLLVRSISDRRGVSLVTASKRGQLGLHYYIIPRVPKLALLMFWDQLYTL